MADSEQGTILPANTDQFFTPEDLARDPAGAQRPATVGASYGHGWRQLKRYFWPLFLIGLIAFVFSAVVGGVVSGLGAGLGEATGVGALASLANLLYQFVVGVPLTYGSLYAYLKAARDEGPEVSDLFVPYQRAFVACIVVNLLLTLCITVGFILLIIPGIIAGVRLSFAPLLVVDEGLGPTEAIGESWRRTRGHFWSIFGVGLLAIPIILVGLILLVVGVIPAAMWVYLAFTSLYASVTARTRESRRTVTRLAY
jgi:uncharacterized membrane protein